MIHFDKVSKRYPGNRRAIESVSLHLAPGEMAFLTGHSGAGKSTLLKLVALIERPTSGQLIVNGQNLSRLSDRHIPRHRRNLGIVFQNHQLLQDRTVFDNVALPLVVAGAPRAETGRRVRAALDKVGLRHREKAYPLTLSGGEQQRVGIARAVVHKPRLLLADEPTGNLDQELSLDIMQLFRQFNQVGVTVLIATHDLDLVRTLGHRTLVLHEGSLHPESRPAAQCA